MYRNGSICEVLGSPACPRALRRKIQGYTMSAAQYMVFDCLADCGGLPSSAGECVERCPVDTPYLDVAGGLVCTDCASGVLSGESASAGDGSYEVCVQECVPPLFALAPTASGEPRRCGACSVGFDRTTSSCVDKCTGYENRTTAGLVCEAKTDFVHCPFKREREGGVFECVGFNGSLSRVCPGAYLAENGGSCVGKCEFYEPAGLDKRCVSSCGVRF